MCVKNHYNYKSWAASPIPSATKKSALSQYENQDFVQYYILFLKLDESISARVFVITGGYYLHLPTTSVYLKNWKFSFAVRNLIKTFPNFLGQLLVSKIFSVSGPMGRVNWWCKDLKSVILFFFLMSIFFFSSSDHFPFRTRAKGKSKSLSEDMGVFAEMSWKQKTKV